jgi:ribonuclease P protein component
MKENRGNMYSFSKPEHLYGEKKIAHLHAEGNAFIVYPLRVVYCVIPEEDEFPAKVMVSVPKKRFKRAVKRNRLKRLIRESYRLNKHALWEPLTEKKLQAHISFQYIADEMLDFEYIEKRMKTAIKRILDFRF